jgi:hypothetical protein
MSGTFDEALRRSGLDVTRSANLLHLVSNFPMLDQRIVDVKVLSGDTEMLVPHGLPRPHTGAIIVACSDPTLVVAVDLPSLDLKRVRVMLSSASASDTSVRLLVF